MNLSSEKRKKLRDALINAFPNKLLLEQMLFYELDKNLDEITGENNLQNIIFHLIKRSMAENWIKDLVRAAQESNPDNLDLINIAEELLNESTKIHFTQQKNNHRDLINKILIKAEKVKPNFLYKVPEVEGYSKEEVVNEIYEMVKDGYLEALDLRTAESPYPIDFQNIKITRKGCDFLVK